MTTLATLSRQPSLTPGSVNVVLFSRIACPFCAIVRDHYLRPLVARRIAGLFVSEIGIDSDSMVTAWHYRRTTQSAFARAHQARLAPTVAFFDSKGRELAERIVGLSQDFFGAYLDAAVAQALRTALQTS